MTHPLSDNYDLQQDAELVRVLRFQAQSVNQPDPKTARLFRQAADRLETLLSEKHGSGAMFAAEMEG